MDGRSRWLVLVIMALAASSFSLPAADPSSWQLKLSLGPGYLQTGEDFQTLFDSTKSRWTTLGYTGSMDLPFTRWLAEASAELIFQPASHIAVGLGFGIITKSFTHNPQLQYNFVTPGQINMQNDYSVTVIPVTLSGMFLMPLDRVTLTLSAGVGYYLGRFHYASGQDYLDPERPGQTNWQRRIEQDFVSDWNAVIGYQASLGVAYRLSRRLSLTADLLYRRVEFKDFQGTYDTSEQESWDGGSSSSSSHSDQAYAWFGRMDVPGGPWRFLDFADSKPDQYDCACMFGINLDGFSLRLGLRYDL